METETHHNTCEYPAAEDANFEAVFIEAFLHNKKDLIDTLSET